MLEPDEVEVDEPNQLDEDDEPVDDEPKNDELVLDLTVFKNGVNVFETYWVPDVAISLLLLLHSIHDIRNTSYY